VAETTTIRDAAEGDAAAVASLWTEAYVTLGVGGRSEPYSVAEFQSATGNGEIFVVDGERGVAGAVALFPPDTPGTVVAGPGEAELGRLAVASWARRQGIGRALLRHCEQHGRSAGWQAIALWSRPAQIEAHRLYESLGYQRLPQRDSVDEAGHGRLAFRLGLARG